ncbi:uncharacterized protein LOC135840532 [Planococcus citri]|uniref:uncharacterized protein LOC135840532 n=1 Tax=Planococcus citri TaxID=170843 RepID=UPI0031F86F68
MKELTAVLGIEKLECSPYHPETNGALERSHGTIKTNLKFYINLDRNNWDEYLDMAVYAFNTAIHSSTNFSPYELLFGRKPVIPYLKTNASYQDYITDLKIKFQNIHEKAIKAQQISKEKSKNKYDKKTNDKFPYAVGDTVKLKTRNTQKQRGALSKPFEGPFKVIKTNYPNVTIDMDGKEKTYHANLLQPFKVLFLFSLIFTNVFSFDIIRNINDNTGLYLNNLGTVGNHNANWHLISSVNISSLELQITYIRDRLYYLDQMAQKLNKTSKLNSWSGMYSSLEVELENIKTTTEKLSRIREKRSILLATGAVALSFLIGLVAAKSSLSSVSTDTASLIELQRRNIQLIGNTIKNFEASTEIFEKNQQILYNATEQINLELNKLSNTTDKLLIESQYQQIEIAVNTLYDVAFADMSSLQNAILMSKQHTLHPTIVTTNDLKKYLLTIKTPSDQMFPIDINKNTKTSTIRKLTDLCTIETEFANDTIYFAISIPLIENEQYFLYESIPFPFSSSVEPNLYHFIIPTKPYVLVDFKTTKYGFLDNLSQCKEIEPLFQICYIPQTQIAIDTPCEVSIQMGTSRNCNLTQMIADTEIWHSLGNNRWLFSLTQETILKLYCDRQITQYAISKNGILTIPAGCKGQSKEYYFHAISDYHGHIAQELRTLNLSIPDIVLHKQKILTIPKLQQFNAMNFKTLSTLQQEEEKLFDQNFINRHQTTVNWTVVVITIIICTFLFIYFYCKCRTRLVLGKFANILFLLAHAQEYAHILAHIPQILFKKLENYCLV